MENVILFLIFAVFTVISINKNYNKANNKKYKFAIARLYSLTSSLSDPIIDRFGKKNTTKDIDLEFCHRKVEKVNYSSSYFGKNINSIY